MKICRLGGLGKKDEVGAFFFGGGGGEGGLIPQCRLWMLNPKAA